MERLLKRREILSSDGFKQKECNMMDPMTFQEFIWFFIIGGIVGWIASVLVKGSGLGFIGDIVFGVFGAVLGGFFARYFHIGVYGFWQTFGMSVVGAAVLLVILRAFPYMRKAIS
jgi:uncharacterized membrane protein YeaQ/YmgE (transglycosylase-associated protein family)